MANIMVPNSTYTVFLICRYINWPNDWYFLNQIWNWFANYFPTFWHFFFILYNTHLEVCICQYIVNVVLHLVIIPIDFTQHFFQNTDSLMTPMQSKRIQWCSILPDRTKQSLLRSYICLIFSITEVLDDMTFLIP